MGEDSPGERDTHVTHTDIYWEERRVLERKARLLAEGKITEPKDEWLSIRLSHTIKTIYRRAPPQVRQAARRALESVLLSWFLGEPQVRVEEGQGRNVFVYNISMSISEARAEANVKVYVKIKKIARELYELRRHLPPKHRELIEELYDLVNGN